MILLITYQNLRKIAILVFFLYLIRVENDNFLNTRIVNVPVFSDSPSNEPDGRFSGNFANKQELM